MTKKAKLLTNGANNPKTALDSEGIESVIMHLSPHRGAGVGNMCAWATEGCILACLNTSGMGQIKGDVTPENLLKYKLHQSRIARTRRFMIERDEFMWDLRNELGNLEKRALKRESLPVARLNGTSDIPWENIRHEGDSVMGWFPSIQFMDYTKSRTRAVKAADEYNEGWPTNYHLTLSRSEEWDPGETEYIIKEYGVNVAVVFDELPDKFEGCEVINGTLNDWRFRDPKGVVVGLLAKGRAKKDTSGFVVRGSA